MASEPDVRQRPAFVGSPERAQTTGARRASWISGGTGGAGGSSSTETSPTLAAARRRRSRHVPPMGPLLPPSPVSPTSSLSPPHQHQRVPSATAGLPPPFLLGGCGGGMPMMTTPAKPAAHMGLGGGGAPSPPDDYDLLTLPMLSPGAAAQHHNPATPYGPGGPKALSGIAVRAFCLGAALSASAVACAALLALTSTPLWRLPFFGACLAVFHFLEFWTTARYNSPAASIDSFLLTANWPAYAVAHASAALECLVVGAFFPSRSWAPLHTGPLLVLLGLALVVVGQTVRSAAMAQAGPSFNHIVQHARAPQHQLVTTGIYGKLRHPSYFGFFYWALGTQLVLGNIVCFVAYALVLWKFFSSRIKGEEAALVRMFGDEYVAFRRAVGTKLPFVP